MNINLREEATNEYISFYRSYLEEIQSLNDKVTDVLNEIMQQTRYEKLQQQISHIIDAYTEIIIDNVESGVFTEWEDSDASLRSCLRRYRAGDAADEVCAQIEQQMRDLMQDILKIDKADVIPTERPIVSEDGLQQLEDICRSGQAEVQAIKSNYLSQVINRTDENEIYGTLKPLFGGISSNMEAFFESALNSFVKLHESVRDVSLQLHNIADENGATTNGGKGINKKLASSLAGMASSMAGSNEFKSLDEFRNITELLYNTINSDMGNKNKKLTYDLIIQIMPIYRKFYAEFGSILRDRFNSSEEREEFVKREYIGVTRERENDQYFDGEEVWTFKSHAYHTYTVFDRVADMEKNIAEGCKNGSADDINLLYGAYVLFTPILEGHINEEDGKAYSKFSRWASNEILKILGLDVTNINSEEEHLEDIGDFDFSGENFNEDNMKLVVIVVERIVNQVGVDELNSAVDRHYTELSNSRQNYSKRPKSGSTSTHNISENTYGRYTVTNKSIQLMAPICAQANSILEPIDKFYKEKFKALGSGFDKANTIIHALSSFLGLWGLGTWKLDNMFSTEDSDKSILEKIQLGGLALASCTAAGGIINGGAHFIKIVDWVMPYLKKSKILVKLSEKVWNLAKQDIQIPYVHKMMDQYIMEHYEIKYGMKKGQSLYFDYYHSVAAALEDDNQRRAFENSVFAAETMLTPQNYIVSEMDPQKYRAICCGIFLNLVRSGMCSKQNIESGISNDIVDKLYNVYISRENVTPRVDIDPGKRNVI